MGDGEHDIIIHRKCLNPLNLSNHSKKSTLRRVHRNMLIKLNLPESLNALICDSCRKKVYKLPDRSSEIKCEADNSCDTATFARSSSSAHSISPTNRPELDQRFPSPLQLLDQSAIHCSIPGIMDMIKAEPIMEPVVSYDVCVNVKHEDLGVTSLPLQAEQLAMLPVPENVKSTPVSGVRCDFEGGKRSLCVSKHASDVTQHSVVDSTAESSLPALKCEQSHPEVTLPSEVKRETEDRNGVTFVPVVKCEPEESVVTSSTCATEEPVATSSRSEHEDLVVRSPKLEAVIKCEPEEHNETAYSIDNRESEEFDMFPLPEVKCEPDSDGTPSSPMTYNEPEHIFVTSLPMVKCELENENDTPSSEGDPGEDYGAVYNEYEDGPFQSSTTGGEFQGDFMGVNFNLFIQGVDGVATGSQRRKKQKRNKYPRSYRPYQCEFCGLLYKKYLMLSSHLRSHTNPRKRNYECDICYVGFDSRASLLRHMQKHLHTLPYNCEICKRGFKKETQFLAHNVIHTGQMPFICETCGKGFIYKSYLETHEETHTRTPPFQCEICGKGLHTYHSYVHHISVHTGQRPFECEECGKGYPSHPALKAHMQTHSDAKPHRCRVCTKRFRRLESLRRHRSAYSKSLRCCSCNKKVNTMEELNEHLNSHAGEMAYRCDPCGLRFATWSELLKHKHSHREGNAGPEPSSERDGNPEPATQMDANSEPRVEIDRNLEPFVKIECIPESYFKLNNRSESHTKMDCSPESHTKVDGNSWFHTKINSNTDSYAEMNIDVKPHIEMDGNPGFSADP